MGQLVKKQHGQTTGGPTPPAGAVKLSSPSRPAPPHTPNPPRHRVRTQTSLQSRRWMQREACSELRRKGRAWLPPSSRPPPRRRGPGPGQAPAMPPRASPQPDAGSRGPLHSPTRPPASPPRSLGAPARTPTSGRVTVSAAPAGPPRPGSRGGGRRRPRWGRGLPCRGAAAPCYCLPGIPPAYRRVGPLPPPSPRCARPPRRRRGAEGGGAAAGPGRAALVFTNSPGNADRTAR